MALDIFEGRHGEATGPYVEEGLYSLVEVDLLVIWRFLFTVVVLEFTLERGAHLILLFFLFPLHHNRTFLVI